MEAGGSTKNTKKTVVEHKCAICPYSTQNQGRYNKHLKSHSSEKPFKCRECPFKSKWNSSLKSHINDLHGSKSPSETWPFQCPESGCGYAAKTKSHLKQHSKVHSDENPKFSCSHPNCGYSSHIKRSLILHLRIHTGEKPWVCQFESCSYAAVQRTHLVSHMRFHTKEKPYKCPEASCEYSAAQASSLKQHQLNRHPKEGEVRPSFQCPLCEYSGKSKDRLLAHVKKHTLEKLFKCDELNCNFEAKTKQEIQFHKVVHSDEKPFFCSVESCEYCCKQKAHLSTHLKSHSDERRYKCELCPYRGKIRNAVIRHLQFVHSVTNFRPFKFTEPKCAFASKTKQNLKHHLLIHKGEKKFSCQFPDCGYRAVLQSMVKQHQMRVHSKNNDQA